MNEFRVDEHPILEYDRDAAYVEITVDGQKLTAKKDEMIAAALLANGIKIHRYTTKEHQPRGIYCGIGQCTDCVMMVNGNANVRTCITPVEEGMIIETQDGYGGRIHA